VRVKDYNQIGSTLAQLCARYSQDSKQAHVNYRQSRMQTTPPHPNALKVRTTLSLDSSDGNASRLLAVTSDIDVKENLGGAMVPQGQRLTTRLSPRETIERLLSCSRCQRHAGPPWLSSAFPPKKVHARCRHHSHPFPHHPHLPPSYMSLSSRPRTKA
jgi:hypothetical protein